MVSLKRDICLYEIGWYTYTCTPQIQTKPNLHLPSPQPVLSELNYQSYYSIFSRLAIKLGKGRMGGGRTVPVCTAEHHLRPNPIFFVFLKVSEIALN